MDLVLAPGHIYLRSGPTSSTYNSYGKDPDEAVPAPPGIQLLATCKQAYQEGHMLYYSSNVFHLPPGPPDVTKAVLRRFQPKHLPLIRRISLRISSIDLTRGLMGIVDSGLMPMIQYKHESKNRKFARNLLWILGSGWSWKACFAARELPALHSIEIEGLQGTAVIVMEPGSTFDSTHDLDNLVKVLVGISRTAKELIFCTIVEIGWKKFKESWCPRFVQEIESEQYHRHRCISRRT